MRKKVLPIGAMIAIVISGPALGLDLPQMRNCAAAAAERGIAERAKTLATKKMLERLKDPDSARFGPSIYARASCDEGAYEIVCGSVNARNSYGGYTGTGPWVYLADKDRYWILVDGDQSITVVERLRDALKVCAQTRP